MPIPATVKTGLDILLADFPLELKGKRIGVVCHAASVDGSCTHILESFARHPGCTLAAVFGPQHGLHGQTQDNMVEWEGESAGTIPVYSLYGSTRKPTPSMLEGIDVLIFDLQDVGARPYTYLWTLKLCMEACLERSLPLWVLDRPNPIAAIGFDGPMIEPSFFSFVGGAEIPLCHRMTAGEIATLIHRRYFPDAQIRVVWMEGWWRDSLFYQTGLPWVLPSPNMPTLDTAIVYPGMVLLEATNVSEGRGTTRPFEFFGAPYLDMKRIGRRLEESRLFGCFFRRHDFIPTFQKWAGELCHGIQVHVTDPRIFRPVETAAAIILAAASDAPEKFLFRTDPYEYEREKPAIDILTGSAGFREAALSGASLTDLRSRWNEERLPFHEAFRDITHYPENRP